MVNKSKSFLLVLSLSQFWLIYGVFLPSDDLIITEHDPLSNFPLRIKLKSSRAEFKKIAGPIINETNRVKIFYKLS